MASLAEIMVSFVGTVPMSLRSAVHRGLEFYGYLPPVATPEARLQSGPFEYRQYPLGPGALAAVFTFVSYVFSQWSVTADPESVPRMCNEVLIPW